MITASDHPIKINTQNEDSAVRDSLFILESMRRYNHWLYSNIKRHLGDRILEVGSGIGNITRLMLDKSRIVALEPELTSAEKARLRFLDHPNITVIPTSLQDYASKYHHQEKFDTAICINVLEHIEDDIEALNQMKKLLSDNGRIVILVPALPVLFGSLDRAFGHYRRYHRRNLRQRFHQAGLSVVASFYMNLTGVVGWFLHSRILHNHQIDHQTSIKFDKAVPYLKKMESLIKPPIGQSLIMVGKKNTAV